MKKIVLVGLAASVPVLAAEPATVPEIRRAQGGAPASAARTEIKDGGAMKLRGSTPELKLKGAREDKHVPAPYGEIKSPARGELKAPAYRELKSPGSGEFKSPAAGELKAPAGEYKDSAFKFRGDAAAAPETAPVQREGPVRY